jgi:hypothetical protein
MSKFDRRFLWALFGVFLVSMPLLTPAMSEAKLELVILEVTGTLVGVDESLSPPEITVIVDEEEKSGPLQLGCEFLDARGRAIPQRDFLRLFTKKYVTLQLYEHSGEVFSCKPR